MTWDKPKLRWRKMYRGKIHLVTCHALGVPPTKEQSWQAANEWWSRRRAEVDADRPPHPHQDALEEMARRRDWARAHGDDGTASEITSEIETVSSGESVPRKALWTTWEDVASDRLWADRLGRGGGKVPGAKLVGVQVGRYLEVERDRVKAGLLSASEHDIIRRCVEHFRDFLGAETTLDKVTADRWEGYWRAVIAGPESPSYKKRRLQVAKNFLRWAAGRADFVLPGNLDDPRHRVRSGPPKPVPTWTVDEVRTVVAAATGQLKLHLLLMINCGMYQVDVADLRQAEVDWEKGTVTRVRSKTRHEASAVTVTHALWPVTFALLRQYRSGHPEWALLTGKGGRWVEKTVDGDGKLVSNDSIKSNYWRLQRRLGFAKPLSHLRKTSASLLETHPEFASYAPHFLGHAPRGVTDRRYVRPSQDRLDRALAWLGEQYGFYPTDG
jgi:integrase